MSFYALVAGDKTVDVPDLVFFHTPAHKAWLAVPAAECSVGNIRAKARVSERVAHEFESFQI